MKEVLTSILLALAHGEALLMDGLQLLLLSFAELPGTLPYSPWLLWLAGAPIAATAASLGSN